MGFRQKSKGLRLGRWEYTLLVLAGLTLFSAVGWWYSHNATPWARTSGRVVGLSLLENSHRINASPPQLRIHYEYVASGRTYQGKNALNAVTRTLYRAVPPDVLKLLREKGYMSFNDLPPRVREALRLRGIERLEAVPEPLMETLRAQGFRSVNDFPDDVQNMAKEGDYRGAIKKGAGLLGDEAGKKKAGASTNGVSAAVNPAKRDTIAPLADGATLPLLYDPHDPQRHKIRTFLDPSTVVGPALTGISALLTVLYCGFFYPWVKQR